MFKQILLHIGHRSRNSGTTENCENSASSKSRNPRTVGATRLILAFAGIAGALTAVLLLFPPWKETIDIPTAVRLKVEQNQLVASIV